MACHLNQSLINQHQVRNTNIMNRKLIALLISAVMLSSCESYQQYNAAATGAMLGGVFGSAIGSIKGGWVGGNIGEAVGMVAGAATGAAISSQIEKNQTKKISEKYGYSDSYGYGDASTRLYGTYPKEARPSTPWDYLEVTNVKFVDASHDGILSSEEKGYLVMDIYNRGDRILYDVAPIITCNNKRIAVSPTAIISSISSGDGIRYKAAIVPKRRLKDGFAIFTVTFGTGDKSTEAYKTKIKTRRF